MLLDYNNKWVYITTDKNASNAIYQNIKGIEYSRQRATKERIADIHFTIKRNPYDRAVSLWASTTQSGLGLSDRYGVKAYITLYKGNCNSFTDFCRYCLTGNFEAGRLFKCQSVWWDCSLIDEFIDITNLDRVIQIVKQNVVFPKINASNHKDYKTYLNKENIGLINQWAKRDFNFTKYGYKEL